jgi:hypothetical protein
MNKAQLRSSEKEATMPVAITFNTNYENFIRFDYGQSLGQSQAGAVATLLSALIAYNSTNNRQTDEEKSKIALSVICANIMRVYALSSDAFLAISLSNAGFTQTRYNTSGFGYRAARNVVAFLEYNNYIERARGFCDRQTGVSRNSRIRARQALVSLFSEAPANAFALSAVRTFGRELVQLRDEDGKPLDYVDTDETRQMRTRLEVWNAFASGFWPDIYIPDNELNNIFGGEFEDDRSTNHSCRERPQGSLDLTQRYLYRVFNNGVWTDGGRFYGGWWQLVPKRYRGYITINGFPTVELDYGSMLISMLYASCGLQLGFDAYSIPGLEGHRKLVKKTLFQLINATEGQNIRRPGPNAMPSGWTWEMLEQALAERHSPIADYFRSGIGIKMQKKDAEIAYHVFSIMQDEGALCLPIHDSFIIRRDRADDLALWMQRTYQHMVHGFEIPINVSEHSATPIAINAATTGYENYHKRHADFFDEEAWERRRSWIRN